MKFPRFITATLLLFSMTTTFCVNAQFGMPSFREVVGHFFHHYNHHDLESFLQFYRNKEGWFVAKDFYAQPDNRFDHQLLWSKESGRYLPVNYSPAGLDSAMAVENIERYMNQFNGEYEEYAFSRNLYYGYPGWDWDVLQEVHSFTGRSDTLLESYARAYMSYASGFIGSQFGDVFKNNDSDRIVLYPTTPLSKTRMDKFVQYELKAISAYSTLLGQNQAYETRVGNIQVKLANEYLYLALELMMAGDTVRALHYADKADYPDSLLKLSQQYLDNIPDKGWLITYGDNDTYPLLYLQWIKQYRPDVKVVNYNLLGLARYAFHLDKSEGFEVFLTAPDKYASPSFDYFRYQGPQNDEGELSTEDWLDHLRHNYNPFDNFQQLRKGEPIRSYFSKIVYLQATPTSKKIYLDIGEYMFRQDFLLLELLLRQPPLQLFATFPIYFLKEACFKSDIIYQIKF